MNDLGKTIIKGKMRIVTPVHIGGAQEKHLLKGLDFVNEGPTIYFLDEKKIIAKTGINQYSNALATNKLIELIKIQKINLGDISGRQTTITGEVGNEIKTNIKNTISGKPIIPGSSLKGSIRSIIYNYANNGTVTPTIGRNGKPDNMEVPVLGRIDEDPFRYFIVNDIEFNRSGYINTKTYNLLSADTGGWKHARNTSVRFNEIGFTFPHEVIPIKEICDFEIVLNHNSIVQAGLKKKILLNNRTKEIFESKEQSILFDTIKNYSNNYLQKEINFFTKYKGEFSNTILDELNRLKELNSQSPLLRLGLGSGFHAMTGDTLHSSHLIDFIAVSGNRTRGKLNRSDSAKSRKLAFEIIDNEYKFYPMGFVQLMTDEYYENNFKQQHEERLKLTKEIEKLELENRIKAAERLEAERKENDEKIRTKLEQEKLAAAEALKPKTISITALKKAKYIDAIVCGQEGKMLLFHPYVQGFETQICKIGYSSGMPDGTVIQVKCFSNNGKTLQFQESPIVKK